MISPVIALFLDCGDPYSAELMIVLFPSILIARPLLTQHNPYSIHKLCDSGRS